LLAGEIDPATYDQIIEKLHGVKEEGESTFLDLTTVANDAARSMADGFVDCLFDPMENSIQDMLLSFLKATAKMIAQAAMLQLVQDGMKSAGSSDWLGSLGSLFSGASNGGVAGMAGVFVGSAKGNVFTNAPGLSAYSGQVVSSPTLFPFAKGTGLMGEAGPEAILPLKRGSDGKLGVTMSDGGGAGDSVVNITINHTGDTKKENTEGGNGTLKELGKRIKSVVLEVIATEKRPGGLLYR